MKDAWLGDSRADTDALKFGCNRCALTEVQVEKVAFSLRGEILGGFSERHHPKL